MTQLVTKSQATIDAQNKEMKMQIDEAKKTEEKMQNEINFLVTALDTKTQEEAMSQ